MTRHFSKLVFASVLAASAWASHAEYPDRPVKLVVPFSPGTSTDLTARELGIALSAALKQPVLIENRTGADGSIAGKAVAASEPDGYLALFTSSSVSVLDPVMRKAPLVDPVKDFTPVCSVARVGLALWVSSSLPFKTAAQFIAAAKAEPGKYTFAYTTATGRLGAEMFQQQAGIQLRGIPYRATMAAMTDVGGGQVDMIVNDPYGAAPLQQAGKLRALTVASPKRLKMLPDVPSSVEAGVPGFELFPWFGVFLPAKTPAPVVARLREAVAQSLKTQGMAALREKGGMEEMSVCGDDVTRLQLAEMDTFGKVVKKAGIEQQ